MKKAFSLIELLISLITISVILTAMAPIITHKLKHSGISVSSKGGKLDFTNCSQIDENCEVCLGNTCYVCTKSCSGTEFKDVASCKCKSCNSVYGSNCLSCNADGCKTCQSGYMPTSTGCSACSAGQYSAGDEKCRQCDYGYYQSNSAQGSCIACGSGKYTDTKGATSCKNCSDSYGVGCQSCNKDGCTYCKSGYGYNSSTKQCIACTGSTYSTGGLSGCSTCGAGTQVNSNKNGCESICGAGTYFEFSSNSCASCSKWHSACTSCSSSGCSSCSSGYELSANTCIRTACSSGEYPVGGTCLPCEVGYKCDGNKKEECSGINNSYSYSLYQDEKGKSDCKKCYGNAENNICCKYGYIPGIKGCFNPCANFPNTMFVKTAENKGICITKFNAGDTNGPPIPSGVSKVNIGSNCEGSKCCWLAKNGVPSKEYTTDLSTVRIWEGYSNFNYSIPSRTLCDYPAAKAICENYSVSGAGKGSWRLLSADDIRVFYPNSTSSSYYFAAKTSSNLGADGLQLCSNYNQPQKGTPYCDTQPKIGDKLACHCPVSVGQTIPNCPCFANGCKSNRGVALHKFGTTITKFDQFSDCHIDALWLSETYPVSNFKDEDHAKIYKLSKYSSYDYPTETIHYSVSSAGNGVRCVVEVAY